MQLVQHRNDHADEGPVRLVNPAVGLACCKFVGCATERSNYVCSDPLPPWPIRTNRRSRSAVAAANSALSIRCRRGQFLQQPIPLIYSCGDDCREVGVRLPQLEKPRACRFCRGGKVNATRRKYFLKTTPHNPRYRGSASDYPECFQVFQVTVSSLVVVAASTLSAFSRKGPEIKAARICRT